MDIHTHIDDERGRRLARLVGQAGFSSASSYFAYVAARIDRDGALPYESLEPNAETAAALQAAQRGEGKMFHSVEELLADLHADDD
jgi:DNA-damage-inducible protein J